MENQKNNKAIIALVFGIISIVLFFLSMINNALGVLLSAIGIGLSITAIVCGSKGKKMAVYKGMAVAGFVCGIVGVCLCSISFLGCASDLETDYTYTKQDSIDNSEYDDQDDDFYELEEDDDESILQDPIEYSGYGDKVITGVNVPKGEYVATIAIDSTSHYAVKWYYGDDESDYNLLVNNSGKTYSGTTLLKEGEISAVNNGELDINSEGNWTIKIQPLSGKIEGNSVSGTGDMVTGLFNGTGKRTVFNIKIDSTSHYAVKLYKYNGERYDYELLVNDSGKTYDGQVAAKTEKGAKYFFVINSEGNWSIDW